MTTEDNLAVIVDYERGATLSYALNAHSPWEGYRIAVNGTEGRAELEVVERAAVTVDAEGKVLVDPSAVPESVTRTGGQRLTLQRHWQVAEDVPIVEGEGGHGGGDALLLSDVFRGPGDDWLERPSNWVDGVRSIAVGMAGNESLRTGLPVKIADLGLGSCRPPAGGKREPALSSGIRTASWQTVQFLGKGARSFAHTSQRLGEERPGLVLHGRVEDVAARVERPAVPAGARVPLLEPAVGRRHPGRRKELVLLAVLDQEPGPALAVTSGQSVSDHRPGTWSSQEWVSSSPGTREAKVAIMAVTTAAETEGSRAASSRLRPPPPENPKVPSRPGSTPSVAASTRSATRSSVSTAPAKV